MRDPSRLERALETLSVPLAGASIYALAFAAERLIAAEPGTAALIEELLKLAVISAYALGGLASSAHRASLERSPLRFGRAIMLLCARRLSLALAAVAVFAAIENLAYFLAFPEAGIAARLAWSMPVHLVSGLLEALGILAAVKAAARRLAAAKGGRALEPPALIAAAAALLACCGAGFAWHWAANSLVSGGLGDQRYMLGAAANLAAFVFLATAFARRAYIGGMLHGAD